MSVVHVKINGIPVEVEAGSTVLAAAKAAGVKIPTLCNQEDLKPTASCGLCIVKMEGSPKIQRACASPVQEGASYITDDPELFKARKTVIEMILSTHPAECLTCIRNQNCELQQLAAEFGIREQPFTPRVRRLPKDESSPSIITDPSKCIKCGRCVEVCQDLQGVYALKFIGRGDEVQMVPACGLNLSESPCVKCGQCAAHCPVGAIYERDDTDKVRDAIYDADKIVVANMAPSVRVAIGEGFGLPEGAVTTGKIYTALRQIGFDKVFDTNFAADLTIMEEGNELVHRLTHGGVLPLMTSCCPAWTDYMEKYYPDMIPNFSTAKSPMQMQGAVTKTYWAEKAGIDPSKIVNVAIMPCTAKKFEKERPEIFRRREIVANLDVKKMMLESKRGLIADVYSQALDKMSKMDGAQYKALCEAMLDAAVKTKDEELQVSASEQQLNQAWLDGYNASHGTQLKFSDVKPDIAGGFILRRGKISANCSWDMLVRVAQEKQESDVVKRLFPAAE